MDIKNLDEQFDAIVSSFRKLRDEILQELEAVEKRLESLIDKPDKEQVDEESNV